MRLAEPTEMLKKEAVPPVAPAVVLISEMQTQAQLFTEAPHILRNLLDDDLKKLIEHEDGEATAGPNPKQIDVLYK